MSPYFEVKHYSKEETEELLKLSMSDKFNIFYNRNRIITNLCRTLIKVIEELEEMKKKK
jgi:hypothetical protein